MKKLTSILLIGLLNLGNAWAGSFSTGAIDTVARANAATAQSTANAAVPKMPGWIFDFGGSTCPTGTLIVGTTATAISRSTYANLFAAIGTAWGAGDGTTTFGLPWIPADYSTSQAEANVGSQTVGVVISHSHGWSGSGTWPAYGGGSNTAETGISYGNGVLALNQSVSLTGSVGATGGAANLAAAVRVLHCIQY